MQRPYYAQIINHATLRKKDMMLHNEYEMQYFPANGFSVD